ncbi:hypothetical protein J2S49_000472 [Arcanobacterium wilhelmae]|uniref:Uncharacterized protein n=1 Tax=Arcanobacterium wilhelmae TaxID=1803177 RepID=A0ABT9N9M5_9ACTO|nr:hypothetical protein [Arcanobacterium wilhelmae]MDP9800396.1 hypothetical protein [Arcanobacterium wilhelmae]
MKEEHINFSESSEPRRYPIATRVIAAIAVVSLIAGSVMIAALMAM